MIQALAPFSFQPPSTRTADISSPPKSLPTPGSLKPRAADHLARDHARQQARDVRRLAVAGEPRDRVVVVDQREGEGEVVFGDLLEGAQLAGEGESLPAMLFGELDRVQAGGTGGLDGLQRIAPLPFPARGIGRDVPFGEIAGARHDGAFFGREYFIEHGLLSHGRSKC